MLACFLCGGIGELYLITLVVSVALSFLKIKVPCKPGCKCKHDHDRSAEHLVRDS